MKVGAAAELDGKRDRPWYRHRRSSRTAFRESEETTSRGSFYCFRVEDGEDEDWRVLALTRNVCVLWVGGFYASASYLLMVSDVVDAVLVE